MKDDKGVSLIEVLVSMFLLALIVGPFVGMFIQSSKVNKVTDRQLKAIFAVRNEMEILMSLGAQEVYSSAGVKNKDDLFIRTTVKPYSPEIGNHYFCIIVKSLDRIRDEIRVYTPDGSQVFLLEGHGSPYTIDVDIDTTSFNMEVDGQSMSGSYCPSSKTGLEINLLSKESPNYLDFIIKGDAEIRVYSGHDDAWNLTYNGPYTLIDRCFYRDYSLLAVKIEAFDDSALHRTIFKIENIIKTPN